MHPSFVSVQESSYSGTFCIFLCHLRWMLDSDFAGLELFCVLLRTHNAPGFVFLCFLFSLPSTSSSPHLHLPNPSLSNVHLAEECVTLQSYPICSQSACCGHARLCICKHFSTQVHRRGVWACDHICEVLYRIFPARLRYRVNIRSILCACNFFDACWKMGHRSITASLCWSAGRQHVLPRDLTEPDNQTNPIHSVSFWHLCLCSDLLFFCFFYLLLYLTGYSKDWKPTLLTIGITVQTSTVKVRKNTVSEPIG